MSRDRYRQFPAQGPQGIRSRCIERVVEGLHYGGRRMRGSQKRARKQVRKIRLHM